MDSAFRFAPASPPSRVTKKAPVRSQKNIARERLQPLESSGIVRHEIWVLWILAKLYSCQNSGAAIEHKVFSFTFRFRVHCPGGAPLGMPRSQMANQRAASKGN